MRMEMLDVITAPVLVTSCHISGARAKMRVRRAAPAVLDHLVEHRAGSDCPRQGKTKRQKNRNGLLKPLRHNAGARRKNSVSGPTGTEAGSGKKGTSIHALTIRFMDTLGCPI